LRTGIVKTGKTFKENVILLPRVKNLEIFSIWENWTLL
jgi:hypothetical protein